jgi:hypothetical protein
MGVNACSCLRSFEDFSVETDLNGDGELEGINIPNNNHFLVSSTDDSTNLTGAGRMSYLMKVNTYDSGTVKNTTFCTLKAGTAIERIQSVFRGSNFRKKFQKNKNEQLNNENKAKENENNMDKDNEKDNKDNVFISEKTKKAEKLFEKKLDYENGWKMYINDEDNEKNDNKFLQEKINGIIKNNKNLKTTKEEGDFIQINNELCLFRGQLELVKHNNKEDNNEIIAGKGELYLKNGVKYEGIFLNGKLNGIGRFINEKFICFEGIFKDGILEGKGTRIQIGDDGNKKIYIGDLKNYNKDGKGKLICKNYIYEGDFVNDKKQGKGKLEYNDNGNKYEGEFNNDDINGYGLYTFKNMHTYKGQFSNGVFHGKGLYKWPDGCYFKGEYVNGVREGIGEYKFSDGKIYKGPFTKGKPNGKGVINIKGNKIDCEFKNGKLLTHLKSTINAIMKNKNSNI